MQHGDAVILQGYQDLGNQRRTAYLRLNVSGWSLGVTARHEGMDCLHQTLPRSRVQVSELFVVSSLWDFVRQKSIVHCFLQQGGRGLRWCCLGSHSTETSPCCRASTARGRRVTTLAPARELSPHLSRYSRCKVVKGHHTHRNSYQLRDRNIVPKAALLAILA